MLKSSEVEEESSRRPPFITDIQSLGGASKIFVRQPNDGFVDLHDFVFGDGKNLASLKLH
jgi:hypothetical protein